MSDASAVALATGVAAIAAALLAGPPPSLVRSRLGAPAAILTSRAARPHIAAPVSPPWIRLPPLRVQMILSACAGAVIGLTVAPPGGVLVGALAPPAGIMIWSRHRRGAVLRKRAADVAEACLALAGELRAGVPPVHALRAVAAEWPELFGPAAGRVAAGGDPAAALRSTAAQPGALPLKAVAAAWEISARTGASLSTVLTAVTDSLRAEESVRREAGSQLASVRATARLLAFLPVATLLLFSTSGTERTPVEFLLGSAYGLACLAAALIFIAAGLSWVERVSRAAQPN
ncbi:type II secretion system F family protein [Phytoactinopolyspora mesophila]|nr:type II secretion system F family protein [Phytoactinopolyspora mesophila]